MKTRKEEITGAVARGWCSKKNSSKTMDIDLAEAIVEEIIMLPCIMAIDIEQELTKLYHAAKEDCLRIEILNDLNRVRDTSAAIERMAVTE